MGTFYQGTNLVVAALIAGRIGWMAIRGGSLELRVIAAALAVTIVAGAHDVAIAEQQHTAVRVLFVCGATPLRARHQ